MSCEAASAPHATSYMVGRDAMFNMYAERSGLGYLPDWSYHIAVRMAPSLHI